MMIGLLARGDSTLLVSAHRALGEGLGGVKGLVMRPRARARQEDAVKAVVEALRAGKGL